MNRGRASRRSVRPWFFIDLACLGLALAVAALLARYRFRAVSTLTVVGGVLLRAGVLALAILG
jgi:hypothetical protein